MKDALRKVFEATDLRHTEKIVLAYLVLRSDQYLEVRLESQFLATALGLASKTVRYVLDHLIEKQYIAQLEGGGYELTFLLPPEKRQKKAAKGAAHRFQLTRESALVILDVIRQREKELTLLVTSDAGYVSERRKREMMPEIDHLNDLIERLSDFISTYWPEKARAQISD